MHVLSHDLSDAPDIIVKQKTWPRQPIICFTSFHVVTGSLNLMGIDKFFKWGANEQGARSALENLGDTPTFYAIPTLKHLHTPVNCKLKHSTRCVSLKLVPSLYLSGPRL